MKSFVNYVKRIEKMTGNKYILTDDDHYVIFTPHIEHSKMFNVMGGDVVSAGFCHVTETEDECGNAISKVECWGESISLGVKSIADAGERISELMNRAVMRGF